MSQIGKLGLGVLLLRVPLSGYMFKRSSSWIYFRGILENTSGDYLFMYSL